MSHFTTDLWPDASEIIWESRISARIGRYEIARAENNPPTFEHLLIALQAREGSCTVGDFRYWLAPDGKTVCRQQVVEKV